MTEGKVGNCASNKTKTPPRHWPQIIKRLSFKGTLTIGLNIKVSFDLFYEQPTWVKC